MNTIKVPEIIREKYEEELFKKNINVACASQMLKILEYGCIVIIRNVNDANIDVLRALKRAIISENEFYNAVNYFNMFLSRIDNGDFIEIYYAEAETQIFFEQKYIKTISITHIESLNKAQEETIDEEIFSYQTKYKKNSFAAQFNYNYLFNKYFGKINSDFGLILKNKDIENIDLLFTKYIERQYIHRFFSPEEGADEAKKNRIIDDLENKRNLEIWEINLLNNIIFNTKFVKI